jgi:hypothetical protein
MVGSSLFSFEVSIDFHKEWTIQERQRRKAAKGFKIPLKPSILAPSGDSISYSTPED